MFYFFDLKYNSALDYPDYEEKILIAQESEDDDCVSCPYKMKCRNQCMKEEKIYNPALKEFWSKR